MTKSRLFSCLILVFSLFSVGTANSIARDNIVSLADIDPSIIIEMRYFGTHNFLGRRVKGYESNTCLLIKDAALALTKIQSELKKRSLSLKIYDCYRPQMAVSEFMRWAKDLTDKKMKLEFYPNEDKDKLIKKGYIAARSGHSRADSFDLTIVKLPVSEQPQFDTRKQQNCTAPASMRYADNGLDMGTGYDCFDLLSHTLNKRIKGIQHKNRVLLKNVMEQYGFRNYKKEWWHFTYIKPYGKKQFYNFPIQ